MASPQQQPTMLYFCWMIMICFSSFKANATLTEEERNCVTIYVTLEDFGESLDADNWNGVYSLDETQTSFNASVWTVNNKYLKYIEDHWVLSGSNSDILIQQTSSLFPLTDTITTWIHEYDSTPALVRLTCSASLSPTSSPSPAPTHAPTLSPTLSECEGLHVTDVDESNNDTLFSNWLYRRLPQNDYFGRPLWQYDSGSIESFVQYLSGDGWTVVLNDGYYLSTYSGNLFGLFPALNNAHVFNITTNDGFPRIFTFVCIGTHYPTSAPTLSPTLAPSQYPTYSPTIPPTNAPLNAPTIPSTDAPTLYPTIAPSINCDTLRISIPPNLRSDSDNNDECISFSAVFDDTYWLRQISRESRTSFTLDCNDANNVYTTACDGGYAGIIFYISNQWEISVYSSGDDCVTIERFTTVNTDHFIPMEAIWMRESTQKEYTLSIQCLDGITVTQDAFAQTQQQFITLNTVYIYDKTWFWISLLLLLLICCLLCIAVYCWRQKRKPIVVYRPPPPTAVKSISVASQQNLELQPAAPGMNDVDDVNDMDESESKDDTILQSTTKQRDDDIDIETKDGEEGVAMTAATAYNPDVNPNLKHEVIVTAAVTKSVDAGETQSNKAGNGDSDHDNDDLWDVAKPQDHKYHHVHVDAQADADASGETDDEYIDFVVNT